VPLLKTNQQAAGPAIGNDVLRLIRLFSFCFWFLYCGAVQHTVRHLGVSSVFTVYIIRVVSFLVPNADSMMKGQICTFESTISEDNKGNRFINDNIYRLSQIAFSSVKDKRVDFLV
jgi:hypothetical protein